MDAIYVIKKPLMTEKATLLQENANAYAFEVDLHASKDDIKDAIKRLYNVRVVSVNTQVRKERARRFKYGVISGRNWKRAIVRLHPDDKIDLMG
jgi:large subunit ribosomal protein L23